MMTIRDPRATATAIPVLADVASAAHILGKCYQNGSFSSAQTVVEAAKRFGSVAEAWLLHIKDLGDSFTWEGSIYAEGAIADLFAAPSVIVRFLASSGIVHDTFQSAFQLSIDITYRLHQQSSEIEKCYSHQIMEVFEECLCWMGNIPLYGVIDLKRVEAVVVFLSAFFEDYFGVRRCQESTVSATDAILTIVDLLERMKGALVELKSRSIKFSYNGDDLLSNEQEKEIRTCYSDIRGCCIATANSIILASPEWVTEDPER